MRAVLVEEFGSPDRMVVRDLPSAEPAPDEIAIEMQGCGVNFPDLMVVAGTYQNLPTPPFSPGKEVAGIVQAVGRSVDGFSPGDRVMAQLEHGGYREQVIARAANCVRLPDTISFVEAAAFGLSYLTCHFALVRRARVQPGEAVLVSGAGGGIGSAGVQLAKALGAQVIAVGETEDRCALARRQGADHVFLADVETLCGDVRAVTGGAGADVVLESVGGSLFHECLRATAWEGRLVVIGFAGGELPTVKAGYLLVKNISVLGLQVSDYRDREPDSVLAAQNHLLQLHGEGRLSVPIAQVLPLEKASEALDAIHRGAVHGKIVLVPHEE
jgi:NADPH:quinone reductase-like Zn-dependent oxidoreductase